MVICALGCTALTTLPFELRSQAIGVVSDSSLDNRDAGTIDNDQIQTDTEVLSLIVRLLLFGPLDLWTFGPLDLWTFAPLDPWTLGPLDLWTFGPLGPYLSRPLARKRICTFCICARFRAFARGIAHNANYLQYATRSVRDLGLVRKKSVNANYLQDAPWSRPLARVIKKDQHLLQNAPLVWCNAYCT